MTGGQAACHPHTINPAGRFGPLPRGRWSWTRGSAERHLPQQWEAGTRLSGPAAGRAGPRRAGGPGVVGPDHPHHHDGGPVRRRGLHGAGPRPVRRRDGAQRGRGGRAAAAAARRGRGPRPVRCGRLPAGAAGDHRGRGGGGGLLHGRRLRAAAGGAGGRPGGRRGAVLRCAARAGLLLPRPDRPCAGALRRVRQEHSDGAGGRGGDPDRRGHRPASRDPLLPGRARLHERGEPVRQLRPAAGRDRLAAHLTFLRGHLG